MRINFKKVNIWKKPWLMSGLLLFSLQSIRCVGKSIAYKVKDKVNRVVEKASDWKDKAKTKLSNSTQNLRNHGKTVSMFHSSDGVSRHLDKTGNISTIKGDILHQMINMPQLRLEGIKVIIGRINKDFENGNAKYYEKDFPNAINKEGDTPFLAALKKCKREVINLFLECKYIDKRKENVYTGVNALHLAMRFLAHADDLPIVNNILHFMKPEDMNKSVEHYCNRTPLHLAALCDNNRVMFKAYIDWMMKNSSSDVLYNCLMSKDNNDITPLCYLFVKVSNFKEASKPVRRIRFNSDVKHIFSENLTKLKGYLESDKYKSLLRSLLEQSEQLKCMSVLDLLSHKILNDKILEFAQPEYKSELCEHVGRLVGNSLKTRVNG